VMYGDVPAYEFLHHPSTPSVEFIQLELRKNNLTLAEMAIAINVLVGLRG
jgi:hypothetical protein